MENMLGSQVSYTDTLNVAACQTVLNKVLNLNPPLNVDGQVGPKTRAAVIEFQKKHGLSVDGIIGPQTSRALQWSNSSMSNAQYSLNDENSWVKSFVEQVVSWFDNYFDNFAKLTNFPIYTIFDSFVGFIKGAEKRKIYDNKIFSYLYNKIYNEKKTFVSSTVVKIYKTATTPSNKEIQWNNEFEKAKISKSNDSVERMSNATQNKIKAFGERITIVSNDTKKIIITKKRLGQMKSNSVFIKELEKKLVEALGKTFGKVFKGASLVLDGFNLFASIKPAIPYIANGKWTEAGKIVYKALMEFLKNCIAAYLGSLATTAVLAAAGSVAILSGPGIVTLITAIAIGVCASFAVKWLLDKIQKGIEIFVKSRYEKFEVEIKANQELYSCIEEGCACTIPSI